MPWNGGENVYFEVFISSKLPFSVVLSKKTFIIPHNGFPRGLLGEKVYSDIYHALQGHRKHPHNLYITPFNLVVSETFSLYENNKFINKVLNKYFALVQWDGNERNVKTPGCWYLN